MTVPHFHRRQAQLLGARRTMLSGHEDERTRAVASLNLVGVIRRRMLNRDPGAPTCYAADSLFALARSYLAAAVIFRSTEALP